MIQGGCRFSKDIPPYIIAGREPIAFSGINIIGLRRRGFANEVIENIHNAYRIIYQSGLNTTEALKKIEDEFEKSHCSKIAVMYAVAYLYEHRENADYKALTLSLRSLLFGIRKEGF